MKKKKGIHNHQEPDAVGGVIIALFVKFLPIAMDVPTPKLVYIPAEIVKFINYLKVVNC